MCAPAHAHVYWVAQSCPTLCNHMNYILPVSSVRGILQARILEWVATSSSRGSSWPWDRACISCIGRWFFTIEPPGKPNLVKCLAQIPLFLFTRGVTLVNYLREIIMVIIIMLFIYCILIIANAAIITSFGLIHLILIPYEVDLVTVPIL